jgi:hypothetical protein
LGFAGSLGIARMMKKKGGVGPAAQQLIPVRDTRGAKSPPMPVIFHKSMEILNHSMKDEEFIRTLYNIFPQSGIEFYRLV